MSEKHHRRFVALEAERLRHGGITYAAHVFGCSERTIERGVLELAELPHDDADPQHEENLSSVLQVHTAGDPDDEDSVWTDLSPRQIAQVATALGTPFRPAVVRNWLDELGMAYHKIAKTLG